MKARGLVLVALVLTACWVGSLVTFEAAYANRIYPGVSIWDIDVGGVRPEVTMQDPKLPPRLQEPLFTLRGPGQLSWQARPLDLGLYFEPEESLDRAYRVGRDSAWPRRPVSQVELLARGTSLPPVLVYDESEARRYLQALAHEVDVAPKDATLRFEGTNPVVEPSQTGRQLDVDATLLRLSPAVRQLEPAEVSLVMQEIQPEVKDAEAARVEGEDLLSEPLTLTLSNPREGDPGPWVIPPRQLVDMLGIRAEEGVLRVFLRQDALRSYLEKLAPALEVEPVDARFHFNELTGELEPVRASREGRALDVEGSVADIERAVGSGQKHVPLAVEVIRPQYPDTATAEETGIVALVATGESYFIGSPSGRDHNIRLAAAKFDGHVIPPGETFSFNHYLGEVTAEAGYDESYITAGEQLEMGIGGGICQVSTTAFRAAFWGGYPIIERWYHGQRVGYYELRGGGVGMDATVYSPHVDLKFVNDRSAPLLIETEVGEASHRLVFRFYSTDDGRRVEKEGPVVTNETKPGPPIYQLDEDLPPRSVTKWQSAVDGLTATIERRVYDAEGEVLHRDSFVSEYEPRRTAYHYGPGYEVPTGESDP